MDDEDQGEGVSRPQLAAVTAAAAAPVLALEGVVVDAVTARKAASGEALNAASRAAVLRAVSGG